MNSFRLIDLYIPYYEKVKIFSRNLERNLNYEYFKNNKNTFIDLGLELVPKPFYNIVNITIGCEKEESLESCCRLNNLKHFISLSNFKGMSVRINYIHSKVIFVQVNAEDKIYFNQI